MQVRIISRTEEGMGLAGRAAAKCSGAPSAARALRSAMESGHESVLEHVSFTFEIDGISRVTLAQLTRHRLASYSVESQRYAPARGDTVIPESICRDGELWDRFCRVADDARFLYDMARERGVPAEDARYILPMATQTGLIMTANARELKHFFKLRCCRRAQWEIRKLADRMLELCRREAPELFADAGPGCVRGACPEGARSCGKPRTEMMKETDRSYAETETAGGNGNG